MKFGSANLDSLKKLYDDQLKHLYSAEIQITRALPEMIHKATDSQLRQALEAHLQETRGHVSRLEQIRERAVGEVDEKKSKGMSARIGESEDMIKDTTVSVTAGVHLGWI